MKNNKQAVLLEIQKQVSGSDRIGIMCGHYPLVLQNGVLLPGIYQDLQGKTREEFKNHPYCGEFPMETFLFGFELLKQNPQSKMISLVNDWQFVPKNNNGDATPNQFRKRFYERDVLPSLFEKHLKESGVENVFLEIPKKYQVFGSKFHFSETRLRNKFDRSFKASCPLNNSCAQEFVPFLLALQEIGIQKLVALIPATCQNPTCDGIMYARKSLGVTIDVYSVYLYQTLDKNSFWEQILICENGEHFEYYS